MSCTRPTMKHDPLICTMQEGINYEDYVVATYIVASGMRADVLSKAVALAVEQSTGSWTSVPGETEEVKRRSVGRVIGVYGVPDYELIATMPTDQKKRDFVVRVAYPAINFYNNIPLVLTTVIGNISSMPFLKLVDLEFPQKFVKDFKGTKFGVQGLRDLLGVQSRPLLNNMIKPCTGLTPEEGAALLYEAARGGVDIVKDDEVNGSPPFSPLAKRVEAYMAAAAKADQEKGEKTLYTVNITDEVNKLVDNAKLAIDAGANALMVSVYGIGLSGLRQLAEHPDINVPIMAHSCYGGVQFAQAYSGVSTSVLAKLVRMCGADMYLNVAPSAKFNALEEKFLRVQQILGTSFFHIKPAMALIGGGVSPGMVPYLINVAGMDTLLGAGAGIPGHPMGAKAGAIAMRQAIDATLECVSLEQAALTSPELKVALEVWGVYGGEEYDRLFELES